MSKNIIIFSLLVKTSVVFKRSRVRVSDRSKSFVRARDGQLAARVFKSLPKILAFIRTYSSSNRFNPTAVEIFKARRFTSIKITSIANRSVSSHKSDRCVSFWKHCRSKNIRFREISHWKLCFLCLERLTFSKIHFLQRSGERNRLDETLSHLLGVSISEVDELSTTSENLTLNKSYNL